jgi:hypothetical protein
MLLEQTLYKEVYVVGVDNTTSPSGELRVYNSFEKLLTHLRAKNICVCSDLRVVHGVLTSAKSIPKDRKGRSAFILLEDPETSEHGILLDSDSDDCAELASEIEAVLTSPEAASFFFTIDHVYILYGYELNIGLSIDEDDLNEDFITDCMQIAEDAKKQLGEE